MFGDIFKECVADFDAQSIVESATELRFNQSQYMLEAAMRQYGQVANGPFKTESLLEADQGDASRKNFIQKMMQFFRRMIAKVKQFLDDRFKLTDNRLNKLQKYLRSVDHDSIEVETYANINNFESVLTLVEKGMGELQNYQLNNLQDTFNSMGKFEKGVEVAKAAITKGKSVTSKFAGYIPSLAKYDGQSPEKIRENLLGVKKVMKGVRVETFYPVFMQARKISASLDKISMEYGKILDRLDVATRVTDKTNMLGPNPQHIFTTIVNALTAFFNRNVSLLVSTISEITVTILSTASKMAASAKSKGMKGAAQALQDTK